MMKVFGNWLKNGRKPINHQVNQIKLTSKKKTFSDRPGTPPTVALASIGKISTFMASEFIF